MSTTANTAFDTYWETAKQSLVTITPKEAVRAAFEAGQRSGGAPAPAPAAEPSFPRFFLPRRRSCACVYVIAGPGVAGGRSYFTDTRTWGTTPWCLEEMFVGEPEEEITAELADTRGVPVKGPFPWMVPA